MFKNLIFQLHWLLGITAGVVLAVVGFTGAMLSFEHDLLKAMNPGVMTVAPQARALTPAELLARISVAAPGKTIQSLSLAGDPDEEGSEGWAVCMAPVGEWLAVSRRQVAAVREALVAIGR